MDGLVTCADTRSPPARDGREAPVLDHIHRELVARSQYALLTHETVTDQVDQPPARLNVERHGDGPRGTREATADEPPITAPTCEDRAVRRPASQQTGLVPSRRDLVEEPLGLRA